MEESSKKKSWGGARPGAGRKGCPNARTVNLKLENDVIEKLQFLTKLQGRPAFEVLGELICAEFDEKAAKYALSINELIGIIRAGTPIIRIKLLDASTVGDTRTASIGDMRFYRKRVDASDGDEIVAVMEKQFNVSAFRRQLEAWRGLECSLQVVGEDRARRGFVTE